MFDVDYAERAKVQLNAGDTMATLDPTVRTNMLLRAQANALLAVVEQLQGIQRPLLVVIEELREIQRLLVVIEARG